MHLPETVDDNLVVCLFARMRGVESGESGNCGDEDEGGQPSAEDKCLVEELRALEVGETTPSHSKLFVLQENTLLGFVYKGLCQQAQCAAGILALSQDDVITKSENDRDAEMSIDDCPLRNRLQDHLDSA